VASLVLLYPVNPDMGKAFPLAGQAVVLGRGADCAIRIKSDSVSRHHARVYFNGDAWVVEDLRSTNGSCVNDVPIERSVLRDADFLKIGNVILKFHLAGGIASPAADDDDGDGGSGAPAELTIRLPKPSN
jgi:pSer/pThr/pTyr-binding forkhead associated (FHA) protein